MSYVALLLPVLNGTGDIWFKISEWLPTVSLEDGYFFFLGNSKQMDHFSVAPVLAEKWIKCLLRFLQNILLCLFGNPSFLLLLGFLALHPQLHVSYYYIGGSGRHV